MSNLLYTWRECTFTSDTKPAKSGVAQKAHSNDSVLVILCIRQYILVIESTDPVRLPISHVEGITKCIGTGTVNTRMVVSQENSLVITCQHSHCSSALCEGESPGSKASSSIHCSTSLMT